MAVATADDELVRSEYQFPGKVVFRASDFHQSGAAFDLRLFQFAGVAVR
jgi:hypothetical protein